MNNDNEGYDTFFVTQGGVDMKTKYANKSTMKITRVLKELRSEGSEMEKR
jgi:predicted flavoprotein YhiN